VVTALHRLARRLNQW